MKKFFTPLSIFGFLLISNMLTAQITTPQPSPSGSLKQSVGLTDITIDYSRPSAKGRKIMGEVVPFDAIWRLGANGATKFTTTDSITIAGKGLAKGTYVVMAKVWADEWEIIFNKNPSASASNYLKEDNVMSVIVKTAKTAAKVETFTIEIGNITSTSATLDFMWENTLVSVPFTNDIDSKIMAQIKQKLDGPTQNDYFAMSQYYLESGKDAKIALEYVDKALDKGGKFWMYRHKSLVLAKMGDKKAAIAAAQKSLEMAKEAKNNDYIRMNEKSIGEWSKM